MMIDLLFCFLVGGGWRIGIITENLDPDLLAPNQYVFFFIWMIETRMQKCFAVCLPIILCLVNV